MGTPAGEYGFSCREQEEIVKVSQKVLDLGRCSQRGKREPTSLEKLVLRKVSWWPTQMCKNINPAVLCPRVQVSASTEKCWIVALCLSALPLGSTSTKASQTLLDFALWLHLPDSLHWGGAPCLLVLKRNKVTLVISCVVIAFICNQSCWHGDLQHLDTLPQSRKINLFVGSYSKVRGIHHRRKSIPKFCPNKQKPAVIYLLGQKTSGCSQVCDGRP